MTFHTKLLLSAGAITMALWIGPAFAAPLPAYQPAVPPSALEVIDPEASLAPELQRQVVAYSTEAVPGTVIVDTAHTHLFFILGGGQAIRYGIGVGREGFAWSGTETVTKKAEWPDWTPPPEMIARQPYLARWMAGGEGNPLGARAIYLGNTLYRIHGTNAPETIGTNVSSGCIRMLNADVADLYSRIAVGTKIVVLPGHAAIAAAAAPIVPARYVAPRSGNMNASIY
jgi:lipoprotein-anchoring transpeptidase ErfK/SrfK